MKGPMPQGSFQIRTLIYEMPTRMGPIFELYIFMMASNVCSKTAPDGTMGVTSLVSHAFCESAMSPEEKMSKNTLIEIHTFSKLKKDPLASLPDSFTVCSTMMTRNCSCYAWPKK